MYASKVKKMLNTINFQLLRAPYWQNPDLLDFQVRLVYICLSQCWPPKSQHYEKENSDKNKPHLRCCPAYDLTSASYYM